MDQPRPFDVFAPACPSRRAFDAIFSRWGILVLTKLGLGIARFGELKAAIGGISDRLLSQTLKVLEDEGLVERRAVPGRVDYYLTDRGQRISGALRGVIHELYETLPVN